MACATKKSRAASSWCGKIWMFPKIVVPQNGWFIMETLLKWMIWGYHYFWKHPDGPWPIPSANDLNLRQLRSKESHGNLRGLLRDHSGYPFSQPIMVQWKMARDV